MSGQERHALAEATRAACASIIQAGADCVEILVGKHSASNLAEEDMSISFSYGLGNWYARYGIVSEWLLKADARVRADAVREED